MPTAPITKRMLFAASVLLAACASSQAIKVASVEPNGCDYLGEVDGDGAAWSEGAREGAVRQLQKETSALGGNLLVCCSRSDTVVLARFEGHQYSGRAYRCRNADDQ
jgi:hypothetical protein